ncbi:hypothetical protein, partial [Klebsiella pneumoniae]
LGCQKACVLPENPASYRVVRTKSYLFNKAVQRINEIMIYAVNTGLINANPASGIGIDLLPVD